MTIGKFFAAVVLATTAAAPVLADSIDFGQFGAEFSTSPSPLRGVTADGVGFTLVGATDFTRYNEGSGWAGEFNAGTPLLYVGTGQMVFFFDHSIDGLTGLSAQANLTGDYTATAVGSLLGVPVVFSTYDSTNNLGPEGSIPHFTLGGPLDGLTVTTTNQGAGFAVGTAAVPEPAAWALMIAGFGLVGTALRRRQDVAVAA